MLKQRFLFYRGCEPDYFFARCNREPKACPLQFAFSIPLELCHESHIWYTYTYDDAICEIGKICDYKDNTANSGIGDIIVLKGRQNT